MNKLSILLTWGLLLAVTHVMAYTIKVEPMKLVPGQSTNLTIQLNDSENFLTAYQLSLHLPDGVTVQKNTEGKYVYTVNEERHDGNFTVTVINAVDGSVLIACFSADKDVLADTDGALITLPLDVASTVNTSLQGSIRDIEFTDVSATAHIIADVDFLMTMESDNPPPVVITDEVSINVPDVDVTAGGSADLVVNLSNTISDLTAYQLSLFLPEGVTVQKDEDEKYVFTANEERHDGDFTISVVGAVGGSLLLTSFSINKDKIAETDGELIRLPIRVAQSVTGSLQGSIKNIEFTTVGAKAYRPANVTFNINVQEALSYIKGDVDGNGVVTAQDALLVLQFVANKITSDSPGSVSVAADVNGDGAITAQDAALILQYVAGKITLE